MIAFLRTEVGWEVVERCLPGSLASTVNLAEVAQRFVREGVLPQDVSRLIDSLGTVAIPPDLPLAIAAGTMAATTSKRGLSLADRFCLALARRENIPALTADRAWAEIADAVGVRVELLR